jgi:hypothetical protein
MSTLAYRRHDIAERVWEPHLPGRDGSWGSKAQDNRQFIIDASHIKVHPNAWGARGSKHKIVAAQKGAQ